METAMNDVYSKQFYDNQGRGSANSAARMAPLILQITGARSVFDLGCGRGHWLGAFREAGATAIRGVDGPWVKQAELQIERSEFTAHDFNKADAFPLSAGEKYDLGTSFEVLEHMNHDAADRALSLLSQLSDVLVVGVAAPGQGGVGHINEQWPSHWYEALRTRGYECFDILRGQLWDDPAVGWWYAQNTLVYARGPATKPLAHYAQQVQGRVGSPLALVHPGLLNDRAKSFGGRIDKRVVQARHLLGAYRR